MTLPGKPFGPINQIAYVVDDLDEAIAYWTTVLGVGPFMKLDNLVFEDGYYDGRPLDLHMTAAMSFSAGLQVELIHQHDSAPSIFTERRPAGGGVHHLAAFTDDLDASLAWLEARGGKRLQGAVVPGGGRIAYVDVAGPPGILELAELQPHVRQLFDVIRDAASHWDGKQQLLTLPA